jgi:hypothetical protein
MWNFFKSRVKCIKVRVVLTHFHARIPYPLQEMAALPIDVLMALIFLIPPIPLAPEDAETSEYQIWNITSLWKHLSISGIKYFSSS